MKDIEKKIIRLMRARDKQAINLLYDHYGDSLYGIVRRIIKEDEAAKGVMQESFIKVWKNIDRYNPEKARLFTWLLRIFRNTAIDQLRKENKNRDNKIQEMGLFVNKSNHYNLKIDTLDIQGHLECLDERFRAVIEKIYLHGYTQQETSEALLIPLGTVKSRLRLGLNALKKIYIPLFICILTEFI